MTILAHRSLSLYFVIVISTTYAPFFLIFCSAQCPKFLRGVAVVYCISSAKRFKIVAKQSFMYGIINTNSFFYQGALKSHNLQVLILDLKLLGIVVSDLCHSLSLGSSKTQVFKQAIHMGYCRHLFQGNLELLKASKQPFLAKHHFHRDLFGKMTNMSKVLTS